MNDLKIDLRAEKAYSMEQDYKIECLLRNDYDFFVSHCANDFDVLTREGIVDLFETFGHNPEQYLEDNKL